MKKIFWGLIFVFFNFTISINNMSLGLIPDFAGYLLMLSGTKELLSESECFSKVRPILMIMFVLSLIFYVIDLLGIIVSANEVLVILINGILVVGSLYCTYMITSGIVDMESKMNIDLAADKLMYKWKVKAMFGILGYLVIFIPILSLICILVSIIFGLLYLIDFNHSKHYYEQAKLEAFPDK